MQNTFYPTDQIRRNRQKRRRVLILLIFLVTGGLLMFLTYSHLTKVKKTRGTNLVTPAASIKPFNVAYGGAIKSATITPLGVVIKDQLTGTTGTYGILVKNLKSGEVYGSNEHLIFESGSLYKLWVMAEAYEQIKQGNFNETDTISEDVQTLNSKFNIDPDLAELSEGTITMTVNQALTQMITISHNYAALLLTEKLGLSKVEAYLQAKGFYESKVGISGNAPTTSAFDMATFFEKLYTGQLADTDSTNKMINLLKAQQLNNKLPKYLPDNVSIAHKTGELDEYSHDAGIVYTPNGDYVIAILSESDVPNAAEDRIAQVSQAVYTYFSKGGE